MNYTEEQFQKFIETVLEKMRAKEDLKNISHEFKQTKNGCNLILKNITEELLQKYKSNFKNWFDTADSKSLDVKFYSLLDDTLHDMTNNELTLQYETGKGVLFLV